jgi:Protein of unknown function (DUF4238)
MSIDDTNGGEKLPRYNHCVPRFILDNFANNGKLSMLDKHTLRQFKLPPYRAMGEKDFNNVRVADRILSFENRFSYIEDRAAPIISRVLQARSLASLSPMDEATLHTFVVVQLLRSKRRRLDHARVNEEIKRRWPEADLNPLKEQMNDEEFGKFFALNFAFSKLEEMVAPLVSKHSFLMIKDCPGELYISDNPMVMHNSKEYGPYGNVGLAVPHIEIYYPLSHRIVLAYMCPMSMKEAEEKHRIAEREVGSFFARSFLSPTGLSVADRIELERLRAEIRRAKTCYAMIKNERAAPISSENLLFLNSLQVLSSYRYLACRTNDFTFATKALSERPHWKEGVGIKFG